LTGNEELLREVVTMKWCAALLPLLVVGCSRTQSMPPVRPQPALAVAQAEVPQQDFVAYVQQSADGTKRAAIWWPGEQREQVLAEGVQGEVHMQPLPNGWPWWNEYALHGRPAVGHPGKPCPLFVDTYTGLHVTPGPELGLDDGHSVLLDLVGDRASVIRQTEAPDRREPSATLLLYRGATANELGRVYLTPSMMSYHRRYLALSPDRDRLAWSGPEGSFLADLAKGEVQKRPREYTWYGFPSKEPERRTFRWLPDESAFIEHRWIDGRPHWELFTPDGQGPVATGEGRVHEISPDCSHWAIVNDEATSGPYISPEDTPRFIRPVPDHKRGPGTRIVTDRWVIDADKVQFFIDQRIGERTRGCFRITPEGHEVVGTLGIPTIHRLVGPVLSLEDGGRLLMVAEAPQTGPEPAGEGGEAVVYDFNGDERFRIPIRMQPYRASLPEYSLFALADKGDDGWRVTLFNVVTGEAKVVLTCQAHEVRVWRAGEEHFIAIAEQHARHRLADLYVGGIDAGPWRLVAEDVCEPVIMPREKRLGYW
jgi:hypothetical protein